MSKVLARSFEARCSCGRVIKLGSDFKIIRDVMGILHPDGVDQIGGMDEEELLSFMAARHELGKGDKHKVTLHEMITLSPTDRKATGKE